MFNPKLPQDPNKFRCQRDTSMGPRDLDEIQEDHQLFGVYLQVDSDCHVGMVIGRCPTAGCKTQLPFVLLMYVLIIFNDQW
jgi:hypothetical protein